MTLYISDLDGTLLNYASKLKPRTVEMLNYLISQGCNFTYATARSFISANPIMKDVNITVPIITMNGVIIADAKTGKPIIKNFPSEKENEFAKKVIIELGEYPLVYADIDGEPRVSYIKSKKKYVSYYIDTRKGDKRFRPVNDYNELFEGEVYHYTLINPQHSREELDNFFCKENGFASNYQEDLPGNGCYWYEFYSSKATKAHAVQQLKEYEQADWAVCFGDNIGDISMLKYADIGCAVANAYPEVKAAADCIIGSNEACGVPMYIENEMCPVHEYAPHFDVVEKPDNERFKRAVEIALGREVSTIGTLNEKNLHSALKNYYATEISQEAKIGGFYADAITESGIFEIQTRSFGKLNAKLGAFLAVCHVTVVYPFEKIVHNMYIRNSSGDLIKSSPKRKMSNLTTFFLELYRIKSFLTNPNLTICIAELEIEKVRYVDDEKCTRKHGQRIDKIPLSLLREIYLEKPEDYAIFLPDGLPDVFTVAQFQKCSKNCDAKLMMEIMEYMSIIEKCGKQGNAFLYKRK